MANPGVTRSVGRPRDDRIDSAVLDSTRRLLVEVGYGELNFNLVAQHANVTRPAIYRRWTSKPLLVHDSLFSAIDQATVVDHGNFAEDLRDFVTRNAVSHDRPVMRAALPGFVADVHTSPDLRAAVVRLEEPARRELRHRVLAGKKRGEVRPDVDSDLIFDMILGTLAYRLINQELPLTTTLIDELTHTVLLGVEIH